MWCLRRYSMIHLTCNIKNLYCSARKQDKELCNSLFERVFYCIYAIPHPDTYLWCLFCHFYIENEVSHATNLAKNSLFKTSEEIWIMKRSAFRLLTEIQQDFIKEFFLATRKAIWSLSLKYLLLRQGFKRFKETEHDWKRPSRGRPAHAGQSFQHQACNLVILYAIGEVEIVTRCANTAQICCKVIIDALDVYRSDSHVLVFLGFVSSNQAPWFFEVLDDAVKGILMRVASNCFLCGQKNSLIKSCQISVSNLKGLLFMIQISSDFLKGEFSCQICGMGDFILNVKMTE